MVKTQKLKLFVCLCLYNDGSLNIEKNLLGEGLVGQCALEKKESLLTEAFHAELY
jgi:hypothetical protein